MFPEDSQGWTRVEMLYLRFSREINLPNAEASYDRWKDYDEAAVLQDELNEKDGTSRDLMFEIARALRWNELSRKYEGDYE